MSENRRLDSWKEIASYVGRTEKTVQRYERTKNFPIHRIAGGSKERVFAFSEEVDQWFISQTTPPDDNGNDLTDSATVPNISSRRGRLRILFWSVLVIFPILCLAIILLFFRSEGSRSTLHSVRVRGNTLAALGTDGKILWEKTFQTTLETEPSWERIASGNWSVGHEKLLYVGDLDRDGIKEIIVLEGMADPAFTSNKLCCLNENGNVKWQFKPGESLQYGNEIFDDLWRIGFFLIDDLDGDGRNEVIVNSHHRLWFPSKISVLDHNGQILGHYYHSGWVASIAVRDLDGDGRQELLCGGTNNEFGNGVLFVLDVRKINGSSPRTGNRAYQGLNLPSGHEKFYIILPRDCINRAIMEKGSAVVRCSSSSIDVYIHSYSPNFNSGAAIFILNDRLALNNVVANSEYLALHHHLESVRILNHPFAPTELTRLEPLLYWDGERFIREPVMNRYWTIQ